MKNNQKWWGIQFIFILQISHRAQYQSSPFNYRFLQAASPVSMNTLGPEMQTHVAGSFAKFISLTFGFRISSSVTLTSRPNIVDTIYLTLRIINFAPPRLRLWKERKQHPGYTNLYTSANLDYMSVLLSHSKREKSLCNNLFWFRSSGQNVLSESILVKKERPSYFAVSIWPYVLTSQFMGLNTIWVHKVFSFSDIGVFWVA